MADTASPTALDAAPAHTLEVAPTNGDGATAASATPVAGEQPVDSATPSSAVGGATLAQTGTPVTNGEGLASPSASGSALSGTSASASGSASAGERVPPSPRAVASDPYSLTSLVWFRPSDLSVYGLRDKARASVANRCIKALIASGLNICVVNYTCLEDFPAMLALWRRMDLRRAALGTLAMTEKGRLPPLMSTGLMVIEMPAPMNASAPTIIPSVIENLDYPATSCDYALPAKVVWAPASPNAFKADEELAALVARINCLIAFWNGNA